MNPNMPDNPYDAPRWQSAVSDTQADRAPLRPRALMIAMAAWQMACLAMFFIYRGVIGRLVVAAYTAGFGDIQASYGTYVRLDEYIKILVLTAPASFLCLRLIDALCNRPPRKWRLVAAFMAWEILLAGILIGSYEAEFPNRLNQLDSALFGPSADLYGFRNLFLGRIIAWLLCTTPVGWMAVWAYSKFTGSRIEQSLPRTGKVE